MFLRNLLCTLIGLVLINTSAQGAWGRVECLRKCTDHTCKGKDVRSICEENCAPTIIGACLANKAASPTSSLSPTQNNLNNTTGKNKTEPSMETTSHHQKDKPLSKKSFATSIQQGAEKFYEKALTEPKITEVVGLSDPHTQGLISETIPGVQPIQNQISSRGVVILLKQMHKITNLIKVDNIPANLIKQSAPYIDNNIIIRRVSPGAFSDQVYIVTIKNKSILVNFDPKNPNKFPDTFVIKGLQWMSGKNNVRIKNRTQPTPVKELQDLMRVKEFVAKKTNELKLEETPDFPHLCFAEDTFFYFDEKGEKKFVAVLSLAGGDEAMGLAKDLMESDFYEEVEARQEWLNIMKNLGKSLGTFHYQLASPAVKEKLTKGIRNLDDFKTIVHGDLHLGNIFFDQDTKKTTLIDVASIADAIYEPISVKRDIARLYGDTKYFKLLTKLKAADIKILNEGFVIFAQGYSEAFPKQETNIRKLVEDYLQSLTEECKDYVNALKGKKLTKVKNNRNFFEEPRHLLYNMMRHISKTSGAKEQMKKLEATVFSNVPWGMSFDLLSKKVGSTSHHPTVSAKEHDGESASSYYDSYSSTTREPNHLNDDRSYDAMNYEYPDDDRPNDASNYVYHYEN